MLATEYQNQGNYEEAVKLCQQSLEIHKELGSKQGIAYTLGELGNVHFRQSNYEEATKLYQQSLKIKEELGDKSGIARSLQSIGMVYEEKDKDFTSALEKYLTALSIYKQLSEPYSKNVENLIARLKEKMGDEVFNKAIEDFRRRHGA